MGEPMSTTEQTLAGVYRKVTRRLLPPLFGHMPGITYAVEPMEVRASAALPSHSWRLAILGSEEVVSFL